MALTQQNLEYIPPSVKPEKLFPGLDDNTIARIEKELENPTDPKIIEYIENRLRGNKYGRYPKELFGLANGFIYGKNGLYAIYNEDKKQIEIIEPGKYGKIKLAKHLRSKEWYILKTEQLDNPFLDVHKNLLAVYQNEHRALTKLNLSDEPLMTRKSSKNSRSLKGYLLMKYAKGQDLLTIINQKINYHYPMHHWPDLFWLHVSIRITEALVDKIHAKSFLHCDIKPENIMYDVATDEATIVDFGSAREKTDTYVELPNKCILGFNAPENFANRYSEKSEVYAFSNILEMLLRNQIPSLFTTTKDKIKDPVRYEPPVFKSYPATEFTSDPSLAEFLKSMRDVSEDKRPNLQEVLNKLKKTYDYYAKDEYFACDVLSVKQILHEASELEAMRLKKAHEILDKQKKTVSLAENTLGLFNTPSKVAEKEEPAKASENTYKPN